jgi:HSP20 family molecular chaperone IbpA
VKEDAMSMQGIRENQPKESLRHARAATPAVDVFENADELLVVVDLPGVDKDGLTVRVEKQTLLLEGKVAARPSAQYAKLGSERFAEVYERSFAIPEAIDVDRISAELKDGVATLRLPKSERAKPRRIPVR